MGEVEGGGRGGGVAAQTSTASPLEEENKKKTSARKSTTPVRIVSACQLQGRQPFVVPRSAAFGLPTQGLAGVPRLGK